MTTTTRKPGLGFTPKLKDPVQFEKWAQRVTEILQVYEGVKGDKTKLDRVVTWRDFEEAGFDLAAAGAGGSGSGSGSGGGTDGTLPPYTTPPVPTGFAITEGYSYLYLSWDVAEYFYLSHTEIWRAEVDNLGVAVKVLDAIGNQAADHVGTSSPVFYYWIRYVSTSGQVGPWSAVAGLSGRTALDPADLLEALENQITSSQLHTSLRTPIELIPPLNASLSTVLGRLNDVNGEGLTLEGLALEVETMIASGGSDAALALSAYNKAVALETRTGDVGGTGITLETLGINFESLSSQVSNPATGLGALATAVSNTQTTVTQHGNSINSLTTSYNGLSSQMTTANNGIAANANAITQTDTNVSNLTGTVSAHTTSINQLSSTVGANTVAIQQEATTRATQTGQLYAQYSVKIDANGRVAGFGLSSTQSEYTEVFHSQFIVSADTFAVGAPGRTSLSFVVDTVANRVVMDGAFIKDATITSAKIQSVAVDKIDGNIAQFIQGNFNVLQSSNFSDANRTGWQLNVNGNHKIYGTGSSEVVANTMQSSNYQTGVQGFRLSYNGFFEAHNAFIRGNVEASSLKVDAANVVSTLHLQGDAVTVNSAVQVNYTFPSANADFSVTSVTFNFSGAKDGQPVVGFVNLVTEATSSGSALGAPGSITWWILMDGVEVARSGFLTLVTSAEEDVLGGRIKLRERHSTQFLVPAGPGAHTFTLVSRYGVGPGGMGASAAVGVIQGNFIVVGGKK